MMKAVRIATIGSVLVLAACAYYTAVPPGRVTVKGGLTVQSGTTWARVDRPTPDNVIFAASGQVETWTIDGEPLDSIIFFAGIADGQPLIVLAQEKGAPLAPFRSVMTPNDVMELFEAMLTKVTGTAIARSRDLRPAKLGNADGFRFEVDYTPKNEVDHTLSAVGAVAGGKLYLIAFQADKLYHYQKYLPEFEQIVASASLSRS